MKRDIEPKYCTKRYYLNQFLFSRSTRPVYFKTILLIRNRNRNRKLLISRAPTKAKSQEPAYSQALNKSKIDRQRSRSRESGRQADSQTAMVDGAWSFPICLYSGGLSLFSRSALILLIFPYSLDLYLWSPGMSLISRSVLILQLFSYSPDFSLCYLSDFIPNIDIEKQSIDQLINIGQQIDRSTGGQSLSSIARYFSNRNWKFR